MATTIQISSVNFNGQTANVTFSPTTGGTINLGPQVIPFNYTNDYYYGTYDIVLPSQTCQLVISAPAPSPTPSVTPTSTPTVTPTNTPTVTPTSSETPTPTPTNTETPTPTVTSTPTVTPTNTETPTPTVTPTNTPTVTPTTSPGPAFDPDAQAFFDAIVASGGTLNTTQEDAINNLVIDLKGYNLWNKFIGLYPVVASGATIQSFNLKNPTQYNLNFQGTWAHTNSGASPSGNGYARTGIIPSVINFQSSGSVHYSLYITENLASGGYDMGSFSSGQDWGMISSYAANINTAYVGVGTGWLTTANGGNTKKNWLMTNDGSTSYIYRDGSLLASGAKTIGSGSNVEIVISSNNNNGVFTDFGQRDWALASIGFGMDATEAANFNTAVVTYQTALGRQN